MIRLRDAGCVLLLSLLVPLPTSAAPAPGATLGAAPLGSKLQALTAAHRIRVRLAHAVPVARVRGYDLRIASAKFNRESDWEIRCQAGRVRFIGRAADGRRELALPEPVSLVSPTGFVTWEGKPYRETLVLRSAGSFCEVVNELDVEKYLEGIVNSEFNSRWHPEAIGAQVIAARTYALFQMKVALADANRTFDVDATTSDQVYGGTVGEDHRASQAVRQTQGLVLTAQAQPLKAFYHATCGGWTELPENVWNQPFTGFRRKVRCPYCAGSPAWNWNLELPTEELARELRRGMLGDDFAGASAGVLGWPKDWRTMIARGRLVGVAPVAAGQDRIERVATTWRVERPRGPETFSLVVPAARLRDWVGPARLRSTFFAVTPGARPGSLRFEGHGNGHGVGMCQWGAKMMGERGFKTAAILKFYYPDATLGKLW